MSPFRLSCKHSGLFVLDQTCQTHCCLGGLGPFCSHNPECSSTSFSSLLNSHLRRQASSAHTCPPSSFSIPPLSVILIFSTEFHLTYCTFISLVLCLHQKNICPMKAGSLAGLFMVIRPATVSTRWPLCIFVAEWIFLNEVERLIEKSNLLKAETGSLCFPDDHISDTRICPLFQTFHLLQIQVLPCMECCHQW